MSERLTFFIVLLGLFYACQKDTSSVNIRPEPTAEYILNDYQYGYYQFFFIDTFYKDHFEKGFSEDLTSFSYPYEKSVLELIVLETVHPSYASGALGLASLNPSLYDSITIDEFWNLEEVEGKLEKGYYKLLDEGKDYDFFSVGLHFGIIFFKYPIDNSHSLAIGYRTQEKKVGTLYSDFDTDPIPQFLNLKLLKCKNMTPANSELWDLMLKNVYVLGDSTLNYRNTNILIKYFEDKTETFIQPNYPEKRFTFLLGLDILDNDSGIIVDDGDQRMDLNAVTAYISRGLLLFPSLRPFDPLPDSRFQLNSLNRAKIYDTAPENVSALMDSSHFQIIIQKY